MYIEEVEEKIFVLLQHEKLPNFCYYCCKIGHCLSDSLDEKERKFLVGSKKMRFRE